MELDLDGVEICWLSASSLLLALKDGQLWQANLLVKNSIVEELKVGKGPSLCKHRQPTLSTSHSRPQNGFSCSG